MWQRLVTLGNAPRAVLFARSIDSLAAGGLIVAAMWTGGTIVVVDRLGDEFLAAVRQGAEVQVGRAGDVAVGAAAGRLGLGTPGE